MSWLLYTDLKMGLGLPDSYTAEDDALTSLAEAACAAVETYCDRSFGQQSRTELYTGNGHPKLPLNKTPVLTTGLQVWVDSNRAFGPDTLLTYNVDYLLDTSGSGDLITSNSGLLTLLRSPAGAGLWWPAWNSPVPSAGGLTGYGRGRLGWPRLELCIKVTSTCGYAVIPADLRQAAVAIGTWLYNTQAEGGMLVGGGSYIDVSVSTTAAVESLGSGAVPMLGSARSILSRYKRVPFATGY